MTYIKNKGFTLIELLAVIAILAIILLVAIPIVLNTLESSKKVALKNSENMLKKAAITYLASNENLIPTSVGVTSIINYSDLKNNNFITPILDQTNKNECINSKIYVTKNADSSITYKPGIVCDNYISLDVFDILQGAGTFSKDSNADGMGDGISNRTGINYTINNNEQTVTPNCKYCGLGFSITSNTLLDNNKYYITGEVKGTPSSDRLTINFGTSMYSAITYSAVDGVYKQGSIIVTKVAGPSLLYLESSKDLGWTPISIKETYMLNLTAIYGAGNEPSKTIIDTLFQKSK